MNATPDHPMAGNASFEAASSDVVVTRRDPEGRSETIVGRPLGHGRLLWVSDSKEGNMFVTAPRGSTGGSRTVEVGGHTYDLVVHTDDKGAGMGARLARELTRSSVPTASRTAPPPATTGARTPGGHARPDAGGSVSRTQRAS